LRNLCSSVGPRLLGGTYRSQGGMDFACKLKVATDAPQSAKLSREMELLNTIRQRDPHHESSRYIVGWLLPSQLLGQDGIFFLDASGDRISLPPSASPLRGLVLESGGMDLEAFLKNETLISVPIAQRIQILEQVVEAVRFVHKVGLVHFDLKPENIVSFTSGHRLRWKLIDFDSSHDEKATPAPVISRDTFAGASLCLTEGYAPPEVLQMLDAGAALPTQLPITWRLDIWSLGVVAFYLLTNVPFGQAHSSSFSSSFSSSPAFLSSLVAKIRQEDVDSILSKMKLVDTKEKSFLQSCLRVEPSERVNASTLLDKTLFSTRTATLEANSLRASAEEMQSFLRHFYETRYPATSSLCSVADLDNRLEELCDYVVPKMTQMLAMNQEEIHLLLKDSLLSSASSPSKK